MMTHASDHHFGKKNHKIILEINAKITSILIITPFLLFISDKLEARYRGRQHYTFFLLFTTYFEGRELFEQASYITFFYLL